MRVVPPLGLFLLLCVSTVSGAGFPRFEGREIDPHVGDVCYAVTSADVNGDGKPDVVAVAGDAVYWYENPSWTRHLVVRDATARDNVCLQARDIDGDGRVDFALGAAWQPTNTRTGGTLQWVTRSGTPDGSWRVRAILSEPTLHRIRWGDVLGTGTPQLIVAPLQGRDTKGPDWGAGPGVRLLVVSVPADPTTMPWPSEVADDSLHTTHNLQVVDVDGDGRQDLLVAAWEGVFVLTRDASGRWSKTQIGTGNQEARPFKGASEVKLGRLRDGSRFIATIEPWHGFQVVVYTPRTSGRGVWERKVIDEPVAWGHAVWCADLDGDGDDEIVIGQRDPSKDPKREPKGPGVFVYDPVRSGTGLAFERRTIDDGGVATEDAVVADLDGDGRPEIVAGGRATHNVKIYWNRPAP